MLVVFIVPLLRYAHAASWQICSRAGVREAWLKARWDRRSEARVSRAVVANPQSPSAQDRLDLKAKAAADQYERDAWERESACTAKAETPQRGELGSIA